MIPPKSLVCQVHILLVVVNILNQIYWHYLELRQFIIFRCGGQIRIRTQWRKRSTIHQPGKKTLSIGYGWTTMKELRTKLGGVQMRKISSCGRGFLSFSITVLWSRIGSLLIAGKSIGASFQYFKPATTSYSYMEWISCRRRKSKNTSRASKLLWIFMMIRIVRSNSRISSVRTKPWENWKSKMLRWQQFPTWDSLQLRELSG